MIAWQITYTTSEADAAKTHTVIVPHERASKAVDWFEQEYNPGIIDRIVNLGPAYLPDVYRIGAAGFQTAEAAGAVLAEAIVDSKETDGPGTIDNGHAIGSSMYYNPLNPDGFILRGGRVLVPGQVMVFHVRQDNSKIDMERVHCNTNVVKAIANDAVVLQFPAPMTEPIVSRRLDDFDYLAEFGAGIVFPVTDYPIAVTDAPQA